MRGRNNLKTEQPHLWQRVISIILGFIAIGTPLLFAPLAQTPNANQSILQYLLPLRYHGMIFITLGLVLWVGVYKAADNYKFLRGGLAVALGYTIMWLLSLIWGAFHQQLSSFAIASLWSVFTFLVYNTLKDPGFMISNLIREVRKHHNVR